MFTKKTSLVLMTSILTLSSSYVLADPLVAAPSRIEIEKPERQDVMCKAVTSRTEVAKAIDVGVPPEQISDVYNKCFPQEKQPIFVKEKGIWIIPKQQSNTFYEELAGCGYHPQRRELVCVVKVKQKGGYNGPAPQMPGTWNSPGSLEWVRFCIAYPAISNGNTTNPPTTLSPYNGFPWKKVGLSAVRLHNETHGVNGPWNYGVVIQADQKLHQLLLEGHTFWARAALSWNYPSPNVSWCPSGYWGNSQMLKIKLDQ
jgi:hypothetical protein